MKIEKLDSRYLVLPLGYLSKNKKIIIYSDEKMVLEFDAPVDMLRPDYFKYLDLSALSGREIEIVTEPELDTPFSFTDQSRRRRSMMKNIVLWHISAPGWAG